MFLSSPQLLHNPMVHAKCECRKNVRNEAVPGRVLFSHRTLEHMRMDKNRIAGSAKQAGGAIKEAAGKVTGDAKLKTEGAADKAKGKVQNAVGGVKDAMRDIAKD
jgi:uncharacterized protein YjbJ (UPF0337 family)